VKRILSKRNGMIERTNTFIIIITFGLLTPSKSVKAAYLKLSMDQYVLNPLRCYDCQWFGHGKSNCKVANEEQSEQNVPKKVIQTVNAKTHLIAQTVRATIVHIRKNVWNG